MSTKVSKRVLSALLALVMVIGLMPMGVFAAETDDALTAALEEAYTFVDKLAINNSSNDPATVVSNFGTHFTWDNELRESKKTYLFDWSYYNGVVFEGIEYLYEVTGEEAYKDYVVEYMSNLIASDGSWATCSNNSDKTAAGYQNDHGADCYKTASLLLDAYEMTGDNRYLIRAEALYKDLNKDYNSNVVILTDAGNNYRHTWATDSDPDLWLDGLYMILPFRAEYAAYKGYTEELDLIVDRMQWVSDNMYNSATGLFYHAANSATDNSGSYWLRSIGWYAAAIVDIMDSMEGENLETMKAQLKKLVDGMYAATGEDVGYMWLNTMDAAYNETSNPYETSGTSLTYYAVMKAVNNGWLDESYADQAVASFVYMCQNKLENNVLTDICFKGAPGSANKEFYDNEGKGVGPFIMLYAEVQEYVNEQEDEETPVETTAPVETTVPETTVAAEPELSYLMVEGTTAYAVGDDLTFTGLYAVTTDGDTVNLMDENGYPVEGVSISAYDMNTVGEYSVTVSYGDLDPKTYWFTVSEPETLHTADNVTVSGCGVGIYDVTASVNTEAEGVAAKAIGADASVTYSLSGTFKSTGFKATVVLTVPEEWRDGVVGVYHVDGEKYTKYEDLDNDPATYTFVTNHFSDWEQTYSAVPTAEGGDATTTDWVEYDGADYYQKVTSMETGTPYVITRTSSTYYALTRSSSSVTRTSVTIEENDDGTYTIEDVTDSMVWYMDSDGHIYCTVNGTNYYLNVTSSGYNGATLSVSTTASSEWTVTASSGNVTIRTTASNRTYYLRYSSGGGSSSGFGLSTSSNTLSLYSKHAQAGGQARLNGTLEYTVRVGDGTTQDDLLSNVTVEWDSDSDGVADSTIALSECDITGSYDNETAGDYTLTISYNNKTLGNVTVQVVAKSIVSVDGLVGSPVTVIAGSEPDYSGVYLEVTYDDGSTGTILYTNLDFSDVDTSMPGTKTVTVTYGEYTFPLTVNVVISYEGLDDATTYPEYPADGAVRIDKTATELEFDTTGLVEVELDVAGISVKQGVDVVLIVDVSNSMGWSLENAGNSSDSDRIADEGQTNKLKIAMDSASAFADILLADNTGTAVTDNTLSFVTFAGYDATFGKDSRDSAVVDSLLEVFVRETSAADAKVSFAGTSFETGVTSYHLTVTDNNGNTLVDGTNRGDTNYDYAFWQAMQTVNSIKEYNTTNNQTYREVYVIFMTDGAPSHYNHNNKQGTSGRDDRWPSDTDESYQVANDYDTSMDTWYEYFSTNANTYAKELYEEIDGNMIAIGFDLAHGGFTVNGTMWQWTEDELKASLSQVAHDTELIDVYATADATELQKIYSDLATAIRFAGTAAQANDVIDSDFTLQMGNTTGTEGKGIGVTNLDNLEDPITPEISIKLYDLYPKGSTDAEGNDITGERTGTVTVVETVTFNDEGTEAYSNLVDDGNTNIMTTASDGTVTIAAHYFTYTKTPEGVESFNWIIGNITDKEIALSFMAYLKGSLEGEEANGLKYTNEEATLEYIDINGDHASQTFPVPAVAWGGASTAYEFYLVNEDGQPCNRNGDVVPFANRIIITGPFYQDLYLNQGDEEIAKDIIAVKVLPAGYTLYDDTAMYTVQTASGNNKGSLTISDPATGKVQTTILVDAVTPTYIQSRVAFGVMYNEIPTDSEFVIAPDQVVIDYGKSIVIDVNTNNTAIPSDVTAELIGFSKFYDSVDVTQQFANTPYSTPFEGTYGTFSINTDGNVLYEPHSMINSIGKIFCVYKLTDGNDTYYMVSELDVIPATVVYYETDFSHEVVFETATTGTAWSTATDGTTADGPQDDGTIGNGQTYGFDSTYEEDNYLSNGSSLFVEGQGIKKTTVKFQFTGTGFDLISRTGAQQGAIRVEIYTDANRTNRVKVVTVLNKSETDLELYQIPVVSVNDLTHGTYYVTVGVNAAYTNEDYPALNRGGEFYFDAIRIYDPAQGNAIAEAAYAADGELNPEIIEVRQELIDAGTFEAIETSTDGVVFVDRYYKTTEYADVATYTSIGPNNEVYLANGQAIAFEISIANYGQLASFDIGVKTITGESAGFTAVVTDEATSTYSVTKEIKSSTAQFINMMNTSTTTALADGKAYVVITNTSDGILSITDIKIAYTGTATATVGTEGDTVNASGRTLLYAGTDSGNVTFKASPEAFAIAEAVLNGTGVLRPDASNDNGNYDVLDASVEVTGSLFERQLTFTVTTMQDAEQVKITRNGTVLEPTEITYEDQADGTRIWTVVVKNWTVGTGGEYTITGYSVNGTAGESKNVSIFS